jgi:hypothetical protein
MKRIAKNRFRLSKKMTKVPKIMSELKCYFVSDSWYKESVSSFLF